jgi:Essential protein Yae1, N terminal
MADDFEDDVRDINEVFDSIVMLEQTVASDGFREGFEKGLNEGAEDAFRQGHMHGMDLGTELGMYRGAAQTWIVAAENSLGKGIEAMRTVIQMLDAFPTVVTREMDLNTECNKIRAAYRKACSLLGTEPIKPVKSTLVF